MDFQAIKEKNKELVSLLFEGEKREKHDFIKTLGTRKKTNDVYEKYNGELYQIDPFYVDDEENIGWVCKNCGYRLDEYEEGFDREKEKYKNIYHPDCNFIKDLDITHGYANRAFKEKLSEKGYLVFASPIVDSGCEILTYKGYVIKKDNFEELLEVYYEHPGIAEILAVHKLLIEKKDT